MPSRVGIPSITYSGSLLPSVPMPRIRTVELPAGEPSVVMLTPGTRPCRFFTGFDDGKSRTSSLLMTDTAPVKSALRCTW